MRFTIEKECDRGIPLHICFGKAREKPQCKAANNLALTRWNLVRCHIVESMQVWKEKRTAIIQL
jgi:hypothetical protein